eukprot:364819-Chlamydomonas_euryale.AAC.4
MKGLQGTPGAAAGCAAICQFFVVAISVAILCINRYQITDVFAFYSFPYVWRFVSCAYSPTSITSCNYLYAVGAFGLLFSILIGFLQCAAGRSNGMGMHACNVVVNFMHLGWWIAAGVYFTVEYNDLPKASDFGSDVDTGIPYSYMRAINALCFTAVAFAALSMIASFAGLISARKAPKEEHGSGYAAEKPSPQQAPMYNPTPGTYAYPPPAPGYPGSPPPTGGYPPAPAGYPPAPTGYPPAPAGYPPPPAGYAPPPARA